MLMNDRRTFLKTAAMATATAIAETSLGRLPRSITLPLLGSFNDLAWYKAPCRFCGTGCHLQVGVENGRVVAVAGDQSADVNKGLLCVKGYHAGSILYGKDRLTAPLLRKGDRHVPISWDEAIDITARRIMAHPDRFAFYGSGQ
ncbi:MAG: twin-arginine translocation signal domain-containing protein, partial [Planctomycetota bacterium]